ncbi:MAG: hypothetical protein R3B09_13360 [Nannocystaceae bacterium]
MSKRAAIEAQAREGQKIQAIKGYREATGSGLLEAKLAVEFFIAQGRWSPESTAALAGAGRPGAASSTPSTPAGSIDLEAVVELIRRREKIAAIKEIRRVTSWGLAAAKDAVDGYARRGVWPSALLALAGSSSSAAPAPVAASTTSAIATPASADFRPVEAFARAGKKIDAIKELRRLRVLGLKDAKDAVEAFLARGEWPRSALEAALHKPMPDFSGSSTPPATSAPPPTSSATSSSAPSPTTRASAPAPSAPSPTTRASSPTPSAPTTTRAPSPTPSAAAPPKSRAPLDPAAAEAAAALSQRLGAARVDQIHAVEKDFARGYLGIVGECAYFLAKRFSGWDVEREYVKSEGIKAEVRTSLSRVELRLSKTFLYDSITGLDEATAASIARLLDDQAKI